MACRGLHGQGGIAFSSLSLTLSLRSGNAENKCMSPAAECKNISLKIVIAPH